MNSPRATVLRSLGDRVPIKSRSIGAILTDSGRLSLEGAETVLCAQKEHGLRFGEAALHLGLVTAGDIRYALARQFEYDCLSPGQDAVMAEVLAAFDPAHHCVESMRALRSQIMMRWLDANADRKGIAIVSADAQVGRSFIAANLAVLLSQLGKRTLLIDADLRAPRQHHLFKLENRIGLSSILGERASFETVVSIEDLGRLSVLPAGPLPPNPQELLARPAFTHLLDHLASQFDVMIVDTPSWKTGSDAQIVSARIGASIFVARADHSETRAASEFVQILQQSGAEVLGAVINRF